MSFQCVRSCVQRASNAKHFSSLAVQARHNGAWFPSPCVPLWPKEVSLQEWRRTTSESVWVCRAVKNLNSPFPFSRNAQLATLTSSMTHRFIFLLFLVFLCSFTNVFSSILYRYTRPAVGNAMCLYNYRMLHGENLLESDNTLLTLLVAMWLWGWMFMVPRGWIKWTPGFSKKWTMRWTFTVFLYKIDDILKIIYKCSNMFAWW